MSATGGIGALVPWAVVLAEEPPATGSLNPFEVALRSVENVSITSLWWTVGCAVIVVLLVVLMFRIRRKLLLLLLVPLTLVVLLLGGAFAVNAKLQAIGTLGELFGLAPYDVGEDSQLTRPTGSWPRGLVVPTTVPGTASGLGDVPVWVYLPPEYFADPGRTFPVEYLLHGTPGFPVAGVAEDSGPAALFDSARVDDAGQRAAKDGHPVVLVAPMISPMSEDTECVDGPQGNWQTFLRSDVRSWVASNPRLATEGSKTAIGGFSLGGFCAQITALRNPGDYALVGNLSGEVSASHAGGDAVLFGPGDVSAKKAEYDSLQLIARDPATRNVQLWLVAGRDDADVAKIQQDFAAAARAQGLDVEVKQVDGGHTFEVWLPGFGEWIPRAAAQLYGEQSK